MIIRKAGLQDLSAVLELYADARAYMKDHGNPAQWGDSYPPETMVREDMDAGVCYVCEEDGEILGVFSWMPGPDPTYAEIEDGAWLSSEPYTVIHRVAVRSRRRGVASACFAYAMQRCRNLRIDTHADNIPMQRSLAKNGFTRCGIIHLANGDPRIAYQKRCSS